MAKRQRGSSTGSLHVAIPEKYEEPKPSFSITERDLPEIKDWTVGKKYKLNLEVEMQSHSQGSEWSSETDKKKHQARLKIISASPVDEKKKD